MGVLFERESMLINGIWINEYDDEGSAMLGTHEKREGSWISCWDELISKMKREKGAELNMLSFCFKKGDYI